MEIKLVDSHCHLYSESLLEMADRVIKRALDAGIARFYFPAIDDTTHEAMIALEGRYPGVCFSMMGLHPCSVKEDFRQQLNVVKEWLQRRDFVAVGEIGLDYYWDTLFKREQAEAFRQQIDWAIQYERPIVIHTRNAMEDTINVVEDYRGSGLRGIFHCFSGTATDAERILNTGFYLGIGGVLTYKNSGLVDAIRDVPVERMVLETDSPYLAPVPFRGKPNESSYLLYIAEKLAEVKQLPVDEIARVTSLNAQNIFGS